MTPTIRELYTLVDEKKALLIDVRELSEWNESHLYHAIHCPLSQLKNQIPFLPPSIPLYIHCRSGKRAKEAETLLKKNYSDVAALPYEFEQLKQEEALYS